jgi:two-component system, NarL family, response regulator YdfI
VIRVQLRASSAIMRTGLEQMLHSESGFQVIPDERDIRNDRLIADEEPPGVIVAEVDDAFEEAGWSDLLDAGGPDTAILLLVDDPASLSAAEALRSGVRGVLPKRVSRDELVAAVHAAAAGLVVLHPDNASTVFPERPRDAGRSNALIEPLTAREMEVLAILAEGGSNKEIASRLSISEHTAKFHVASIMGKLGATSRTEAVTLAIRRGMIML